MKTDLNIDDSCWDIRSIENATIVRDFYEEGIRVIVMKGPFHWCAYLGIELDHPLAGYAYDLLAIDVHGGLTFSREGDGKVWPKGFWWYGWDYGHAGDWSSYYEVNDPRWNSEKRWTLKEVTEEAKWAAWDVKRFKELAEKIHAKARQNVDVI